MSKKIVALPQPKDAAGNILTAEAATEKALQPDYVPVVIERNGEKLTFFVACDFDEVDNSIETQLRGINLQRLALRNEARGANTADPDAEVVMSQEQMERATALGDRERDVMKQMALGVILDHNVPGMPAVGDELKAWFDRSGRTQQIVLDAVIEAYDPSTAAANKQAQEEALAALTNENQNESSENGLNATPAVGSVESAAATSKKKAA